ncbi:MAG: tetratricopeptide repeat protein [Haliscomenobacter sp.]|nr:tetratricopeptide repeat protein [Haliscomenobacter sp.]
MVSFYQPAHQELREGDKNYRKEDFPKAEESYRKSLTEQSTLNGRFNLGNTVYQQKRWPEAVEHFSQAAEKAKTSQEKAAAYYNLGNAHYQMGEYPKSIEAYKNALRQNPADIQSKHNLALAMRKQQEQQQKQQQQNQQNQNNNQQQPPPPPSPQKQNQQPQQNQENENQTPPSSPEPQAGENTQPLSREEAEALLRIVEGEEKRVQSKMRKDQGNKPIKSKKDW